MIAKRLITGLLTALFVSGLFTFWLSKKFVKQHPPAPRQQYVATSSNLEAGEVLSESNVKLVDWPSTSPLEGAFIKPADVVGRTVLYPLATGEPVLSRQLASAGAGLGLSNKIPEGMRAIALKSDQIVGVAGFMLPGTHVDVLVTYHSALTASPVTSIVLQDVQILAIGQKTAPDPDGKANTGDVVTLLVKPEDAEKAVLASTQGTVHFVLRNGADHLHVADSATEMSSLGGAPVEKQTLPKAVFHKVAAVDTVKPYAVETVNGTKQSVETFQ